MAADSSGETRAYQEVLILPAVNKIKANFCFHLVFSHISCAEPSSGSLRESVKRRGGRAGRPALRRQTQCDGASPAVAPRLAASAADTGARLSSPGDAENIAKGGEGRLCVGEL